MHFLLSSSSAPRWAHCAGSVIMEAEHPDVETIEAAEGTASHWVVEQVLRSYLTEGAPLTCRTLVGQTAPNGIVINDAMADGAQLMTGDVLRIANEHGALRKMLIEHMGQAPTLIHPAQGGTMDVAIPLLDYEHKKLYLWDYKFGHQVVEARDNYQMVCYYAQLVEELQISGIIDQNIDVHIRIVQPRAYRREGPVREWKVKASDLRAHINLLHHQAHKALEPDAETVAGAHCMDCKAAGDCETLKRGAQHAMKFAGQSQRDGMATDDEVFELTLINDAYAMLKARKKGRENSITAKLEAGEHVAGFALERGYGREKIAEEHHEAVKQLGAAFGVDVTKTTLQTPNQIAALGIEKEYLAPYIIKPVGEAKLVEADKTIAFRAFNNK